MKNRFLIAITILAVVIVSSVFAFAACENSDEGYTLTVPDGAPALSVAMIGDSLDADGAEIKLNRKIVSPSTINSEAPKSDFAVVPANLAAKMYNEGADIKLLATVTNGNLYISSNMQASMSGLNSLTGKIVYSIGQNSVPDIIFKTLLKDGGIDFAVGEKEQEGKVVINYCAGAADAIAKMSLAKARGKIAFGLYGEPSVSKAVEEMDYIEVFDLQSLWRNQSQGDYAGYAQAVLIAKSQACKNAQFVDKLLQSISLGLKSAAENPKLAEKNIKNIYPQTELSGNITADVISRCNVDIVSVADGRDYYERTLRAVYNVNPKLIGGKLPDDGFYYSANITK